MAIKEQTMATEERTMVRVLVGGEEWELYALEQPGMPGLYHATVYRDGQAVPTFKGRTLHAQPAMALSEAFTVMLRIVAEEEGASRG